MPTPRAMISGSSAAAILGLSEWATPFQAWSRIMESRQPGFLAERGYAPLEKVDNAATRWGSAFEDSVVMLTEHATGEMISCREMEFFGQLGTAENIASCHIDGILGPNGPKDNSVLYEGKTTFEMAFRKKWGEPGTDRIPTTYQCQTQHNMMLTGAERCTVGVLVFPKAPQEWEDMGWEVTEYTRLSGGFELVNTNSSEIVNTYPDDWASVLADIGYYHTYEVPANRDTQKAMREAYQEFWSRHIIEQIEPDPSNWEDIRRMFTAPVGTVVADDELFGWLSEYKDIRKEIGASGPLKKRQDQLKTLAMDKCRKMNPVIDDDSQEKMIIMSSDGHKLASFDGKTFR